MAQSFTKYAKDLGINVDNMIQAFEVSGKSETVVNFLEELYKIRNKPLYYLSFNLHSYNIHNYLLEFQEEELAKYTTIIDNFNRVSFKGSVIQGKNMKDCSHVEIIIRRVIDGPPKNKYKQYETPSSYDIERLKSIPTSPKSFFKKEHSDVLDAINDYNITMQDFYAKEEDIRELIGIKISLSKKNYLSYMGHSFILEAGRGNKWMIQSDSINKELISLFTRNNIIGESESDSSSEESSED